MSRIVKIYRLFKDGQWVTTETVREWWESSHTGDIWQTEGYVSTRVIELPGPNNFIPPRDVRDARRRK